MNRHIFNNFLLRDCLMKLRLIVLVGACFVSGVLCAAADNIASVKITLANELALPDLSDADRANLVVLSSADSDMKRASLRAANVALGDEEVIGVMSSGFANFIDKFKIAVRDRAGGGRGSK